MNPAGTLTSNSLSFFHLKQINFSENLTSELIRASGMLNEENRWDSSTNLLGSCAKQRT
jgi:hypothetical protein